MPVYRNRTMRVAVAFDHRGVKLRERVLSVVEELGHEAVDLGTDAPEPRIDYPDKAQEVGDAIRSGAAERARASSAAPASAPPSRPASCRGSAPRSATMRTRPTRASSTTT